MVWSRGLAVPTSDRTIFVRLTARMNLIGNAFPISSLSRERSGSQGIKNLLYKTSGKVSPFNRGSFRNSLVGTNLGGDALRGKRPASLRRMGVRPAARVRGGLRLQFLGDSTCPLAIACVG